MRGDGFVNRHEACRVLSTVLDRHRSRPFEELAALVGDRSTERVSGEGGGEFILEVAVSLGRDWVLLQQFHDFCPDGFTALRLRDITEIRSGEYERHWERMVEAEGLLDQVGAPEDVSLEDTSHLLKALHQRGQNVIVECEDPEDDIEDFYIGQVLSVDDHSVCEYEHGI
jgi:hypothetical protein